MLSSPLQRALETCRLAGLGDAARTTEDLLEWDYGEYEGITTAEIRESRPDWYLWRDGCPGGEKAADVGAARGPRDRLARRGSTATWLCSPTATCCGCWRRAGSGWRPRRARCSRSAPGTLSVLGYERETRVIRRWNAPVAGGGGTAPR